MTTRVKVIHDGGSHPVVVELVYASGDKIEVTELAESGDSYENYVYDGQAILVTEKKD
jgi:hypothetical protein